MRVVVSGREGQVVRSLMERASGGVEIVALGRPELDLAGDSDAIIDAISSTGADLIVSAAAYTQVDQAEREPEIAFEVNENGPRALAIAARQCGIPLIHISTDYVFDGMKTSPYIEEDAPRPTSVYGASKLAGERAVLAEYGNSAILRTAWVYSPFGKNFVKTMLRLAADNDEVTVVADQHGNPTSALHIADGVFRVAANLLEDSDPARRGVFHMTAPGDATWAEFAEAIFSASAEMGGPAARVKRICTADYPTAAKRPASSRLDSSKLERLHGVRLPEWRSSLRDVVSRLLQPAA